MAWFVPGRIEVFGKHTDYAGGRSILAASAQGVSASVTSPDPGASWDQGVVHARSTAVPSAVTLKAGQAPSLAAGHWGHYVQATVDRLTTNFGPLRPAAVEIDSTLPLASGMSSSSALVCAVALALADHNDLWARENWGQNITDFTDLAAYLATIENGLDYKELPGARGVGTFGGSQDHTAMLNCQPGELGLFQFSPTQSLDSFPMPTDHTFVVAVSGALAEKTGAAKEGYNNASLQAGRLLDLWNEHAGTSYTALAKALENEGATEELFALTAHDPLLSQRLTAYTTEMDQAIPAAIEALAANDVAALGKAATLSHQNADANLGNQIPETNYLQQLALDIGAPASSAFGAGFGGSVWAMVPEGSAEEFAEEWLGRYLEHFPQRGQKASTLITTPSAAAHRIP